MTFISTMRGPGRARAGCAVLIAAALLTFGGVARAADAEVTIDNFTFSPQTLTIKAGTKVRWTNRDDIPHTIASTTKAFRSPALDTDDNYSFTFTTAGSYEYFCSLHPHMTGTIVVQAADGPAPSQ
jgi:plastocyanin